MTKTQEELTPEERAARRRSWLRERCNVPRSYLHASKETWDAARAPWPSVVDDWSGEGAEAILTLKGEPGIGKTHVAVSILSMWASSPELIDRLHKARYTNFPDRVIMIRVPHAIRALRRHYETRDTKDCPKIRGKSVPAFLADVAETFDLVIYDDWGSQTDRDNWWETIEGWVDDRHAEQLPTIVTMNDAMERGASSRVTRRLVDGLPVDMPWRAGR